MSIIDLRNVTLDFPIYGTNTRSIKRQLVRMSTGGFIQQNDNQIINIRAIDNISLTLNSWEIIGLIGHNGAGKTTLLKLLSGIYTPTCGEININGKVSTLLDMGLGMNPELNGYENIKIYGIIHGLTRKQIANKAQEIAEFTDLGDYLQMPIRTYSSGMRLRLAFSLATSLSAQILILDEIVGVGDSQFMVKAQKRLQELIAKSELVVFASHSISLISQFCNKVIWMQAGKIAYFGDVKEGIEKYSHYQQAPLELTNS